MPDAGKYRHRVNVLHFDGTQDALGSFLWDDPSHWNTVMEGRKASIDPLVGKELYEAMQSQSLISHKIRTRFTESIHHGDRITWNGHTFHVESAINWEMKGKELLLMCREVV